MPPLPIHEHTKRLKAHLARRKKIAKYAEKNGNAAAAREFKISRERVRQVREEFPGE